MPSPALSKTREILSFKNAAAFRRWLKSNGRISPGFWMKFAKKGAPTKTLSYVEARDQALCFGWIDSQVKSLNEHFYLQRFSPRRPKSLWSKVNRLVVEKLIKTKQMAPWGQKEVDEAKADGRWKKAYDSPSTIRVPKDFAALIKQSPRAVSFWKTLPKSKRYPMLAKLQMLKTPSIRHARMHEFVALLEQGKTFAFFASKKNRGSNSSVE